MRKFASHLIIEFLKLATIKKTKVSREEDTVYTDNMLRLKAYFSLEAMI